MRFPSIITLSANMAGISSGVCSKIERSFE